MKPTAKPSSRQLNLGLLHEALVAIPGDKQPELARALVELLIAAARGSVEPPSEGGDNESKAHG